MWLYDEASVLIVWFWGVSLWVGKYCKMTFNHFCKFLVLGVWIRGFLFNRVPNLKPV